MRKENRQKGFTLIEVIAVLIIVGIMAAFAGFGIIAAVQGYLFSKNNAAMSEKAQLVISRINRELVECYNCAGTSGSVSMPILNPLGQRYLRLNAGNIEISADNASWDTLTDKVSSFSLAYNVDKNIEVTLSLTDVPNSFSTKVYPRNTP